MPSIYNIRQDPFERTPILNSGQGAPAYFNEFFGREGWRFVFVQKVVAELGETAIEYPPVQAPASFNLSSVNPGGDQGHAKVSSRQGTGTYSHSCGCPSGGCPQGWGA
jgi:hypothetical protein